MTSKAEHIEGDLRFILEADGQAILDAIDVARPIEVFAKTNGLVLSKRWTVDGRNREVWVRCEYLRTDAGEVVPAQSGATLVVETPHARYELEKSGARWTVSRVEPKQL